MLISERKDYIEKWLVKNQIGLIPGSCKVMYYPDSKKYHATYFIKGNKTRENIRLEDSDVDNIIKEIKNAK